MEKLFRFVPERLPKIVGIEFADLLVILGSPSGKLGIRALNAAQPVAHVLRKFPGCRDCLTCYADAYENSTVTAQANFKKPHLPI